MARGSFGWDRVFDPDLVGPDRQVGHVQDDLEDDLFGMGG